MVEQQITVIGEKPEGVDKKIVQWLLEMVERYKKRIRELTAENQALKEELRRVKSDKIEQKRKLLSLDKNPCK